VPDNPIAPWEAQLDPAGRVNSYEPTAALTTRQQFATRPFVYLEDAPDDGGATAVAHAMLDDQGILRRVTLGPAPLWGSRRGQDVMMTEVLGFDMRVYDPGAPLFQHVPTGTVLTPNDPGWRGSPPDGKDGAYFHQDNMGTSSGIGTGNTTSSPTFPYVGQGAYVDMGYGYDSSYTGLSPKFFFPTPRYNSSFSSAAPSWFFSPRALSSVYGGQLAPGFAVYDTWSFHYENNGVNEDGDEVEGVVWQLDDDDASGVQSIDEGTNSFDDFGHYPDGPFVRLGPDDLGERETVPPYDKPLRGVQVVIRTYELDSRAIRQVRVNQHFLPE
jgi:hypothetical protein